MRRSSISKQGMTTRSIASHIILLTLALFASPNSFGQTANTVSPRDQQEFARCMARLEAIPVEVDSINPVRNIACIIDDAGLGSRYREAEKKKLADIAGVQGAQSSQKLASARAKHMAAVNEFGFSKQFLNATIYLQANAYNRPRPYIKFSDWLALLIGSGNYSSITKVSVGQNQGVMLKRPGTQSAGFLFVLDDGELFPSHLVANGKAHKTQSVEDQVGVAMLIAQAAD